MADAHHEDGILDWLDGPRLVVGAFVLFLLGLTFFGIVLWSDQRKQVERIDALAEKANQEQVNACFERANQGPALRRVLRAIEKDTADPRSREQIRSFSELNFLNTPTVRECRQLAGQLHVPIPKGEG